MANPYLLSAYAITVLLFGLYGWSIAYRQQRARKGLEELKKQAPSPAQARD